MSDPLLTASHHRIRLKIALQNYRRKGGLQMSENQYDAPAMEVVEFGKDDAICTSEGGGWAGGAGWEEEEGPF